VAAEKHHAPGSFAVAWLDALYDVPTADIEGLVKLTDVEGI